MIIIYIRSLLRRAPSYNVKVSQGLRIKGFIVVQVDFSVAFRALLQTALGFWNCSNWLFLYFWSQIDCSIYRTRETH